MSEHTPGPWEIDGIDDMDPLLIVWGGNDRGLVIAEIETAPWSISEAAGNAYLVKAAPKMYDALKAAVRRLRETSACGLPDDVDNRLNMICGDMQAALDAAGGDNDSD